MTTRSTLVLACALLLGLACSSTSPSRKSLSEGERLFRAKCRSCHILPKAHDYTNDQWDSLVRNHGDHLTLTETEIQRLIEYLQQNN